LEAITKEQGEASFLNLPTSESNLSVIKGPTVKNNFPVEEKSVSIPAQAVINQKQQSSEVQQKVVVEKTENTLVEKPKNNQEQQQPTKAQVTPAFNPGVRTTAPNDIQKPASVSVTAKRVEQEPEPVKDSLASVQMYRRNQQTPLANKESRIFLKDLRRQVLKNGVKYRVTFMAGDLSGNMIKVTEAFDGIEEYFDNISTNIREHLKNDKVQSYKPQKNEVVLAKFEGDFYRAFIKGINEEATPATYRVFFIDYGNTLDAVSEEDIRKIGPKLNNEIILHTITFSNLPKTLKGELTKVFGNPAGFEIEVESMDEKTSVYTVRATEL
jgi:hypothetical protein